MRHSRLVPGHREARLGIKDINNSFLTILFRLNCGDVRYRGARVQVTKVALNHGDSLVSFDVTDIRLGVVDQSRTQASRRLVEAFLKSGYFVPRYVIEGDAARGIPAVLLGTPYLGIEGLVSIDLDYKHLDPITIFGIAALILALSFGYFLIKKAGFRLTRRKKN